MAVLGLSGMSLDKVSWESVVSCGVGGEIGTTGRVRDPSEFRLILWNAKRLECG